MFLAYTMRYYNPELFTQSDHNHIPDDHTKKVFDFVIDAQLLELSQENGLLCIVWCGFLLTLPVDIGKVSKDDDKLKKSPQNTRKSSARKSDKEKACNCHMSNDCSKEKTALSEAIATRKTKCTKQPLQHQTLTSTSM